MRENALPAGFKIKGKGSYTRVIGESKVRTVVWEIECPYPSGSRNWTAIADHYDGKKEPEWSCPHCGTTDSLSSPCIAVDFLLTEDEKRKVEAEHKYRYETPRRVVFPRAQGDTFGVLDLGDGNTTTVGTKGRQAWETARVQGFDSIGPDNEYKWKIVTVRFDCTDGKCDWIIAALPVHWDDDLPLSVMRIERIG